MSEIQDAAEMRYQTENPDIPDEVDGIPLEHVTGNHIRKFFEIKVDGDGSASSTMMYFSERPFGEYGYEKTDDGWYNVYHTRVSEWEVL